jgi:hypothetical protein
MNTTTIETISAKLAVFVNETALALVLLPERETVRIIKALKADMVVDYLSTFAEEDEATKLANEVLRAVIIQKFDIEQGAGANLSRTLH